VTAREWRKKGCCSLGSSRGTSFANGGMEFSEHENTMERTLRLLTISLLIAWFATACNPDGGDQPDCTVNGINVAYGDKVPSNECGGCVCADAGQLKCTQEDCTPQTTYDTEEPAGGWGVSEYYCCCKSGCPPGSGGCITMCLVFGGSCSQSGSDILQACQGSTPLKGCTCAPDNESTVAPQ
jgi:hypothetical protein